MLRHYRRQLIDLFGRILELRAEPVQKMSLSLTIQEELIRRISYTERRMRALRSLNKTMRVRLAQRGSDKQVSRNLKAMLTANHGKLEFYQQLLAILRDVGDCLAFTYIDRWDIKPLVFREPAGFLAGKRGNRLERACLRLAFRHGVNAILNDLTHSLRYGDLTFFMGGRFHFIEAKSGGGGSRERASRQVEAAQRVLDYLATDRTEHLYVGVPEMTRREVHAEPVYHETVVRRMAMALPVRGWLRERVEPGLHYFVCDAQVMPDVATVFCDLSGRHVHLSFTNDIKTDRLGYYPILLNLGDPDQAFRFYNGEFVIVVMADISYVAEALAEHGYKLMETDDDRWPLEIRLPDGEGFMRISYHLMGRLGAEFLSLEWLIAHLLTQSDWFVQWDGTHR